jgi:hypothetical protein
MMKYVPKAITRAIGTTALKTQKNSPTLLFVAGVAGFGATVFLACKATMKVESILTDHEKDMLDINRQEYKQNGAHDGDWDRERRHVTLKTWTRLGKEYAPAAVCGVVSIACLTKSHKILGERNAQLTAAYVGLQKFLESYRGRVRQEIGKEKERDVYYASTPVELVQDTPEGPKKIFGSKPGQRSPYSQIFDDNNSNWQDANEFNLNFIRIQEQLLTDKLRAQGSLMLNEVYDRLDLPRTPTGALCGWVIGHPDSDDFVEIEVVPMHDYHGTLMLDFNVAGMVYDMLSGRASGRKS